MLREGGNIGSVRFTHPRTLWFQGRAGLSASWRWEGQLENVVLQQLRCRIANQSLFSIPNLGQIAILATLARLAGARPAPGRCQAGARPMEGRCQAGARPAPGRCQAGSWPVPGRFHAGNGRGIEKARQGNNDFKFLAHPLCLS